MKQKQAALPKELDLLTVIGELARCHAAVLHTGKKDGSEQSSHPGADFSAFPMVMLVVEKAKDHFFGKGEEAPYLIVHPERLTENELLLRIDGAIEKIVSRDALLWKVTFKIETIQLKKAGTLSTKETWHVGDEEE